MGVDAHGQPNGADNTRSSGTEKSNTNTKTTAYYIAEGVNGCFKDRVLCGVNFEPCPVSLTGGRRHRQRIANAVAAAAAADADAVEIQQDRGRRQEEANTAGDSAAAAEGAEHGKCGGAEEEEVEDEDAVVMGPSGLPTDVVARKRLPKSLKPGDWLYFSQMGAYTASIATVTSSAVLEASYCYVASTPGVGGAATVASRG